MSIPRQALWANIMALIGLMVLGILWSLHIVFAKLINAHIFPHVLAVLLLYIAVDASILLLAFVVRTRRLPLIRPVWVFFTISALFGYVLPVQLDLLVAPQIPLSHFALIAGTGTMMALLISWSMNIERPNRWRLLGVSLGFIAMLVLFGSPFVEYTSLSQWYIVALLLPFSYAFCDCYIDKYWPRGYGTFEIAVGDSLMGLLLVALIVICYMFSAAISVTEAMAIMQSVVLASPWGLLGLIVTTLVSLLLFYHMLNHHGAVFVASAIYIALLSGTLLGVALFNETLKANFFVALLLLFIGLVMVHCNKQNSTARHG